MNELFGPAADQTQLSDLSDVAAAATDVLPGYLELQVLQRSYHLWSPGVHASRLYVQEYVNHVESISSPYLLPISPPHLE